MEVNLIMCVHEFEKQHRELLGQEHDTLDTSGLICPEPVMLLHNKIRKMASRDVIQLIATDPSSERDVTRFCEFLGHDLLCLITAEQFASLSEDKVEKFVFWIRKK